MHYLTLPSSTYSSSFKMWFDRKTGCVMVGSSSPYPSCLPRTLRFGLKWVWPSSQPGGSAEGCLGKAAAPQVSVPVLPGASAAFHAQCWTVSRGFLMLCQLRWSAQELKPTKLMGWHFSCVYLLSPAGCLQLAQKEKEAEISHLSQPWFSASQATGSAKHF